VQFVKYASKKATASRFILFKGQSRQGDPHSPIAHLFVLTKYADLRLEERASHLLANGAFPTSRTDMRFSTFIKK
jgi:hypothetical protein